MSFSSGSFSSSGFSREALRPAMPCYKTFGTDSPYDSFLGKPVHNELGLEIGRLFGGADRSGGVLKNHHGFTIGNVHKGLLYERGYVKGCIEHSSSPFPTLGGGSPGPLSR